MAESRGRPGSASQRPTGGDKAVLTQKKQYFRRKIQLDEPIKQLGEHKVVVRLHRDVTAEVTVNVVRDV